VTPQAVPGEKALKEQRARGSHGKGLGGDVGPELTVLHGRGNSGTQGIGDLVQQRIPEAAHAFVVP
uniref:hypothetical protein n=1 Tax=Streptomyces sp. NRRL S-1824 TaxID=1463889 RepID=UPI001F24A112